MDIEYNNMRRYIAFFMVGVILASASIAGARLYGARDAARKSRNETITGAWTFSDTLNPDGVFSTPYQQVVNVAKAGGDYTTIQGAISSITDAGPTNRYVVNIWPGTYIENITLKNNVSLYGMSPRDFAIISGTSDTLIVFADSSCGIRNLKLLGEPTDKTAVMILAYIPSTNYRSTIRKCDFEITSSVNDIEGTFIDIQGGDTDVEGCLFEYTMTGDSAAVVTHELVKVEGTSTLDLFYNIFRADISDSNDIAILVNETAASDVGMSLNWNTVNMSMSSASFSGACAVYYAHGANNLKNVLANHFSLDSGGDGTAYCFYQNTSGNNGEIHCTGNRIIVEGFALNYLGGMAAGDTLVSHLDDVVALDGITGGFKAVSSMANGALTVTDFITGLNQTVRIQDILNLRLHSIVAGDSVIGNIINHDADTTAKMWDGSTWQPFW